MTFKVLIDDNFHYADESERYAAGEFATLEEAVAAAQKIVDDYLASAFKIGMTSDELMASYAMFGDDPFIVGSEVRGVEFSGREYARQRAIEICAGDWHAPRPGKGSTRR